MKSRSAICLTVLTVALCFGTVSFSQSGVKWWTQIASQSTEEKARSTYEKLMRQFPALLKGQDALIAHGYTVGRGRVFRVGIGADSRQQANAFCQEYKTAGGTCFATRLPIEWQIVAVAAATDEPNNARIRPTSDRYEGEMRLGAPHGKGIMIFDEGDRYTGDFLRGQPDGKGVLETAEGDRFEGEFKDGRPNGHGILQTAEGFRYEGTWSNGEEVVVRRVGVRKPPHLTLAGPPEPQADKPSPQPNADKTRKGVEPKRVKLITPPFGASFDDQMAAQDRRRISSLQEFLNLHGYGAGDVDGRIGRKTRAAIRAYARDHELSLEQIGASLFIDHVIRVHPDTRPDFRETDRSNCMVWTIEAGLAKLKVFWSGKCSNGFATGYGTLRQQFVFFEKKAWIQFEGMLIEGRFSGPGKLTWHGERVAKNQAFVGNFAKGMVNGEGEIVYPDGRRYIGSWKDGRFDGAGVYSTPTFGRLEGTFVRGLPNGHGRHYDPKGQFRMEGFFHDGCLKNGDRWVFILTTRDKCGF